MKKEDIKTAVFKIDFIERSPKMFYKELKRYTS